MANGHDVLAPTDTVKLKVHNLNRAPQVNDTIVASSARVYANVHQMLSQHLSVDVDAFCRCENATVTVFNCSGCGKPPTPQNLERAAHKQVDDIAQLRLDIAQLRLDNAETQKLRLENAQLRLDNAETQKLRLDNPETKQLRLENAQLRAVIARLQKKTAELSLIIAKGRWVKGKQTRKEIAELNQKINDFDADIKRCDDAVTAEAINVTAAAL